jgi:hypothetical protein
MDGPDYIAILVKNHDNRILYNVYALPRIDLQKLLCYFLQFHY